MIHGACIKLGTKLDRRLCTWNQPNNQINKCVGKAVASQYIFEFVIFVNERIEVQENSCGVRTLIHLKNVMACIFNRNFGKYKKDLPHMISLW